MSCDLTREARDRRLLAAGLEAWDELARRPPPGLIPREKVVDAYLGGKVLELRLRASSANAA
jgi:hypothetical protein